MTNRSKLSNKQRALAAEWQPLVKMLARCFVQNRPGWQRSQYIDDLEGEGYLALAKAARTYDPSRLPYPKAYFARAIMNAMYKQIKRATRMPGTWKISLAEAAELLPVLERPDYLGLAVSDLGDEESLAADRFLHGHTLRTIAENHSLSLRAASVRSRALASRLAESLGIRLPTPQPEQVSPSPDTKSPLRRAASSRSAGKDRR